MGDAKYSDSLELMTFLANLVGSEHIERFIPLAEAQNERPLGREPAESAAPVPSTGATATREMPKFLAAKRAPPPTGTAQVARTERKTAASAKPAVKKPASKATGKSASAAQADHNAPSEVARAQVIADAARLVQWGRKWYELPDLIARMADRPALPEVRRILKENKSAIDAKAGGK
jgi:hypothetical protein